MIVEVTKFQTEDGTMFNTLREAQQHDTVTELQEEIYGATILNYEDSEDLARILLAKYNMVRIPV